MKNKMAQDLLQAMQRVLKIKQDHANDPEACRNELMKVGIGMVMTGVQGLLDLDAPKPNEKPMIPDDDELCQKIKANADRLLRKRFPMTLEKANELFKEQFPDPAIPLPTPACDPGQKSAGVEKTSTIEPVAPKARRLDKPLPFWYNHDPAVLPGTSASPTPCVECSNNGPFDRICDACVSNIQIDREQLLAHVSNVPDGPLPEFDKVLGNYDEYPTLKSPGLAWLWREHMRLIKDYPGPVNMALFKRMIKHRDKPALYCAFHCSISCYPIVKDDFAHKILLHMIKRGKMDLIKLWFQMRDPATFHDMVTRDRNKALRCVIKAAPSFSQASKSRDLFQFLMRVGQCTDEDVRNHKGVLLRRAALHDENMCYWLCETYNLRGRDVRAHNLGALRQAKDDDNIKLLWYLTQRL
jgi:hypothetical protein